MVEDSFIVLINIKILFKLHSDKLFFNSNLILIAIETPKFVINITKIVDHEKNLKTAYVGIPNSVRTIHCCSNYCPHYL